MDNPLVCSLQGILIAVVSFAQLGSSLLRAAWVAVSPCAGFAGGVKLLLICRAQRWEEFNMEVEVRIHIAAVDRCVVHTHHVWEFLLEHGVEHPDNLLEGDAEICLLLFGHLGDVGDVPLRENIDAIGVLGEERQKVSKIRKTAFRK